MNTAEILETIHRRVDISGVRADVSMEELRKIAAAAKHYRFVCAFALPCFTPYLLSFLRDEPDIHVGATIGFPSGADTTFLKVASAKEQIAMGVDELDMVINIGAAKSGRFDLVENDIRAVVEAADGRYPVKSILEVAYLTDDEIRQASEAAVRAGVTYVKTGTGWAGKPTTVETIRLIKSTIGDAAKIKAAGGVRTLDTMLEMIDSGCDRFGIGLRSNMSIMKEVDARLGREDDFSLESCENDLY
ncbi:MAG: deoxyribose-phosphate aldolase [Candidatus Limiplasma sp.]|nr:deoxyribose-phosphate aldolase [Candidatus Limiplasma sp.]